MDNKFVKHGVKVKHGDHIGYLLDDELRCVKTSSDNNPSNNNLSDNHHSHSHEHDHSHSHDHTHEDNTCEDENNIILHNHNINETIGEEIEEIKSTNTTIYVKFGIMIALIGSYMIVEFVIGTIAGSISLQADAFHMLSDLAALIIALYSVKISNKKQTSEATFGYTRAEIIGAFFNAVFLISSCFFILLEAIHRFINISEVEQLLTDNINMLLITAGVGGAINVVGIFIFGCNHNTHDHNSHSHSHSHSHGSHSNLNIIGVLLHIIGDLLGSIGVIVSGVIIKYTTVTTRFYADPSMSLIIVAIILFTAIPLLKTCINILMHKVPSHINIEEIKEKILKIDGVVGIHHFHVWQHTNNIIIGTLHLVTNKVINMDVIEQILHKGKIHTTTIQIEIPDSNIVGNCVNIVCGKTECHKNMCCDDY